MEQTQTLDRLNQLFRNFFGNETLQIDPAMTAQDVNGWDSLNHIALIVSIERTFKISFTTKEVGSMRNVGDLIELIDKKNGHTV